MRLAPLLPVLLALIALPALADEGALPSLAVSGRVTASFGGEAGPHAARFLVDGIELGEGPSIGDAIFVVSKAPLATKTRLRLELAASRRQGYRVLSAREAKEEEAPEVASADLQALDQIVQTMLAAAQKSDWKALSQHVIPLKLDDPAALFGKVFPAESAKLVADEYAEVSKGMVVEFRKTFQALLAEGAGPYRCFEARGPLAVGLQRRAQFAMQTDLPLYTVQFDRAGIRLWNFVYLEGAWRYVGKLQALPREPLVLEVRVDQKALDVKTLQTGTLRLVIKNASEETVEVPSRYDGRVVRLVGRGRDHYWASRLRPRVMPPQRLVPLEPGKERVLLEVSLVDVFTPSPEWGWDWGAHPVPPQTPIHRWRKLGHESDVLLYLAAEVGERTQHSKPIRLTVSGE